MKLPFYIAKKFFKEENSSEGREKKASRPAIRVATFGVAIGIAVMIISVGIVGGYKQEIGKKITGFVSHIEVLSPQAIYAPDANPISCSSSLLEKIGETENVKKVARVAEKIGIIKTSEAYQGIRLKGIATEYDTAFLHRSLVSGRLPNIAGGESSGEILISQSQADDLQLEVGSSVFAYFFEDAIKTRRFRVVGIFRTNLKIFDDAFVITDMHTVCKLNSWDTNMCSFLEIQTSDEETAKQTNLQIAKLLKQEKLPSGEHPISITAKEHYPQIFSWLELLDFNIWVILALMISVGIFTMISGLLILILERTATIGTLKALGATNSLIRQTFLCFSTFIVGRGLLLGNLLGLGFIWVQDTWGLIRLDANNYYMEVVPVELNIPMLVLLNVGTLVVTILALVAPSFIISKIEPAKAIRFD